MTLRHSSQDPGASNDDYLNPGEDEGRGVQLFDLLGGENGQFNAIRIADELNTHHDADGAIDVRPIALAITRGLIYLVNDAIVGLPPGTNLSFFDTRHGLPFKDLLKDSEKRAQSLPRRKAELQKLNLDRSGDVYLSQSPPTVTKGLIAQYDRVPMPDNSVLRLRREVFRRPFEIGVGVPDKIIGGVYVDRESYGYNTPRIALYRYFLEPLGVSVDRWSMGVRGRSRTYTFADVFSNYMPVFRDELTRSLIASKVMTGIDDDDGLMAAVNRTLAALPGANDPASFIDVQRIFNKGCIECHGGLNYPPYRNFSNELDFSQDEAPAAGKTRLSRSHELAELYTSRIWQLIAQSDSEECALPIVLGMMPCGGPNLSQADVKTFRRWMNGASPSTNGDPHIRTVNGITYDFQAAGEFAFARNEGLEIQVRQVAFASQRPLHPDPFSGLTTYNSLNGAVAIRMGGQRITYQPNSSGKPDPTGLQLRINGVLTNLEPDGLALPGEVRIRPTTAPGGILVEGRGGTAVVITPGWWDYYQVWYLNIDTRRVRTVQGLTGTVAPRNWLPALPNGKLLGARPDYLNQRYKVLYEDFGNAWRVTDGTSLFDYAPETSTKTFTVADWPGSPAAKAVAVPQVPGGAAKKPPLAPIALERAKEISKNIGDENRRNNAIRDVMVTGEPGFAQTYLDADRVQRRALPTAPALAAPGETKTWNALLDSTPKLTWKKSTHPEPDSLNYKVYVWQEGQAPREKYAIRVTAAQVAASADTISISAPKLEPNKTYYWKVIVEDRKGGSTETDTWRIVTRRPTP